MINLVAMSPQATILDSLTSWRTGLDTRGGKRSDDEKEMKETGEGRQSHYLAFADFMTHMHRNERRRNRLVMMMTEFKRPEPLLCDNGKSGCLF